MKLKTALFLAALLCGTAVIAQHPADFPLGKADGPLAGKGDEPPGVMPAKPNYQLGRAKPKAQYDWGHFRAIVGSDGKTRYFPRLSKSIDNGKRKAPPPASVDYSAKAPNVIKRMYLNDQYGDCVIASRFHRLGIVTANESGVEVMGTDNQVYATYQSACGRGDNGCDMSAVNQYEQTVGLKATDGSIHKIDAAVSVDSTNQLLVMTAIDVFGGLNVGLDLPNAWYTSPDGGVWDMTNTQIVGGHEVQAVGYDAKGVKILTWGGTRTITWQAFTSTRWINEVYTSLAPDWYAKGNLAPNGIDAKTLLADLQVIANGGVPPLPDPVPPTPVPPTPVPPTPVPPVPGQGFTGSLIYVNGVLTQVNNGVPATGDLKAELTAAGVNPQVIADVLQLVADVKAKKGFGVILGDVMKIIADLQAAPAMTKADLRDLEHALAF